MSVKKQLQAFYKKQGLTGKHLRSALRHDMRRVRQCARAFAYYIGTDRYKDCLSEAFVWCDTPEGVTYWLDRHEALRVDLKKADEVAVPW